MKCAACGHEETKFKPIEMAATWPMMNEPYWQDGVEMTNYKPVEFFACPKCHTVRVERRPEYEL